MANTPLFSLSANLVSRPLSINSELTPVMKISGVQDVQVNGLSIVSNNTANLVLGPGLTYDDNGLQMVLTDLPSVVPKDLNLEQQNNITILTDNNGTLSKASVNSLDYTKLKVVNQEDLSIINTDDFLFVKEVNK